MVKLGIVLISDGIQFLGGELAKFVVIGETKV
jgi:hypothetical protein